jgi:hypothetical protein
MRRLFLAPLLLFLAAGCGQRPDEQGAAATEDRTDWRKLSKGMTPEKVRAVLGEPVRVEDQEEVTCWYYRQGEPLHRDALNARKWVIPRGSLLFSARAAGGPKLAEWREP